MCVQMGDILLCGYGCIKCDVSYDQMQHYKKQAIGMFRTVKMFLIV